MKIIKSWKEISKKRKFEFKEEVVTNVSELIDIWLVC